MESQKNFTRQDKKIISLAALGGMFEFYDFVIYGIFSLYFSNQFFPTHNSYLLIIQNYFIFLLGYVARPIGGIIFSHIGDEYGRKKVLIITMVFMGFSSLGMGILPTYSQIGVIAPLLLLVLRLLQGLALGGELPSTYVYISESIHHKRGLAFGITMAGVNGGLMLGMLVNELLSYLLHDDQLRSYGWRIPFIIGGLICFVSYHIRKTLHETAAFNKIHDKPKLPLIYLIQNHFKLLVIGTGMVSVMSSLVVASIVFMPTYLHSFLNITNSIISYNMSIVMILNVIFIYLTGQLADYFKSSVILKYLLVFSLFLIPLSYYFIHLNYLLLGMVILGCLEGIAAMLIPIIISTLFPANIRLTGVAMSYNIGFTIFGGFAPLIITKMIEQNVGVLTSPTVYLLFIIPI